MKNFFYVAALALVMTACAANGSKEQREIVATDVVPVAATEVLPAAAPVPGLGTVATDVVPAE